MIGRIRLYLSRRRLRRARADRRRTPAQELETRWRYASASVGLVAGSVALASWVYTGRGWAEALSTGASVAFLTVLFVEVLGMILGESRLRTAREAMERERERERAEIAALRAQLQTEREWRERERELQERDRARSQRLEALLLEVAKEKGLDADLIQKVLE